MWLLVYVRSCHTLGRAPEDQGGPGGVFPKPKNSNYSRQDVTDTQARALPLCPGRAPQACWLSSCRFPHASPFFPFPWTPVQTADSVILHGSGCKTVQGLLVLFILSPLSPSPIPILFTPWAVALECSHIPSYTEGSLHTQVIQDCFFLL